MCSVSFSEIHIKHLRIASSFSFHVKSEDIFLRWYRQTLDSNLLSNPVPIIDDVSPLIIYDTDKFVHYDEKPFFDVYPKRY